MKLQEALQQIVKQFGESILEEKRLAYLLSDFLAFEDYPAMQQVMKTLVAEGYGEKLYKQSLDESDSDYLVFADGVKKQLVTKMCFKKEFVNYAVDSISFAIGKKASVLEPFDNGFDPYKKKESVELESLDQRLHGYKQEYTDAIEQLITLPEDIVHDAPGYFTVDALNKLYGLQLKIQILQKELNITGDDDWSSLAIKYKLDSQKEEKRKAVEVALENEKKKFEQSLQQCIVLPEKSYIRKSGHLSDDAASVLDPIEAEIKVLYKELNKKYDDYCKKLSDKTLSKYVVTPQQRKNQIIKKIIAPGAIALLGFFTGINYLSSKSQIDTFNTTIEQADQAASQGDLGKAMGLYQSAKDNYDGTFMSSMYEGEAEDKIQDNFKTISNQCEQLISENKLGEANELIKSIPQTVVNSNEDVASGVKYLNETLTKSVDTAFDDLIKNVYVSGGSLNQEGQALLDQLLQVKPNDYWLNFIKNKVK